MPKRQSAVTAALIERYLKHLREQERSAATLQKYAHDLKELCAYLQDAQLTKAALIAWKEQLIGKYAPATVNSMLTAANGYLRFYGWGNLTVKQLKVQKSLFADESKELTREEYAHLVQAAQRKDNERLALVIQTICATGIRVSELRFITVEAVQTGRTEISNKGKRRLVFLPAAALLRPKTKKDHRGGIHHPDGQALGQKQYLAGHEGPVRERRSRARKGVPP